MLGAQKNGVDKAKLWFSTPKWRPADVAEKYPVTKNDLSQFIKYDPKTSLFCKIFGFGQLVFVSLYSPFLQCSQHSLYGYLLN